jgi:hypothetical protein
MTLWAIFWATIANETDRMHGAWRMLCFQEILRYFYGHCLWLGATTALCHLFMNYSLLVSGHYGCLLYASFLSPVSLL